jgi:hypothetical protein
MSAADKAKSYSIGQGRTSVNASCSVIGDGAKITITGGERPHIGAVAMALPRDSLLEDGNLSADIFVLPVPGHKDDIVARLAANEIASYANMITVVVAGIHSDNITESEIREIIENVKEITRQITADLS